MLRTISFDVSAPVCRRPKKPVKSPQAASGMSPAPGRSGAMCGARTTAPSQRQPAGRRLNCTARCETSTMRRSPPWEHWRHCPNAGDNVAGFQLDCNREAPLFPALRGYSTQHGGAPPQRNGVLHETLGILVRMSSDFRRKNAQTMGATASKLRVTGQLTATCHVYDRFWTATNQQINLVFDPNTVQITPSRFFNQYVVYPWNGWFASIGLRNTFLVSGIGRSKNSTGVHSPAFLIIKEPKKTCFRQC